MHGLYWANLQVCNEEDSQTFRDDHFNAIGFGKTFFSRTNGTLFFYQVLVWFDLTRLYDNQLYNILSYDVASEIEYDKAMLKKKNDNP